MWAETEEISVKFPYWGVLNHVDTLCIKISPILYIANPNPNPTGPSTPQYGNYPQISPPLLFMYNYILKRFNSSLSDSVKQLALVKEDANVLSYVMIYSNETLYPLVFKNPE